MTVLFPEICYDYAVSFRNDILLRYILLLKEHANNVTSDFESRKMAQK